MDADSRPSPADATAGSGDAVPGAPGAPAGHPAPATPAAATAKATVPRPDRPGPVPVADRIAALDVLRGLALLGIVMVNVFAFALPFTEAFSAPPPPAPSSEEAGFAVMRAFFQLKWMPIFSVLFGAGLAVQVARAAARGDDFVPRYLRRIGVLLLIGLAHALLLWFGDILVWYAVLGAGLLFVRGMAAPRLIQVGAALVVVGGLLAGGCFGAGLWIEAAVEQPAATTGAGDEADEAAGGAADDAAAAATAGDGDGASPGEDAGDAASVAEDGTGAGEPPTEAEAEAEAGATDPPHGFDAIVAAEFDPGSPAWIEAETRAYADGPWTDAFAFRLVSWAYALVLLPFGWAFIVFGCFMIGAGLLRSGFFDPSRAALQARVALIGLLVGVPLEVASAAGALSEPRGIRVVAELVHGISGPVMAIGLLAGITWLVSTGRTRAWDGPVRAAGRAALSVYLGQTILGTAVFHWWGLGLFGEVPRLQLLVVALVIWTVLAGLATVWLRVFRFGPAEWLWRSLTYGRLQPFLRSREYPRTPGAAAIDAPVDADLPSGEPDDPGTRREHRVHDAGTGDPSGGDAPRP